MRWCGECWYGCDCCHRWIFGLLHFASRVPWPTRLSWQHRDPQLYKELGPLFPQYPPCEDSRRHRYRLQTLEVRIEGEDVFDLCGRLGSRPWKCRREGCFRRHFRPRGGAISPSWPEFPYLRMLLGLPSFSMQIFSSSVENSYIYSSVLSSNRSFRLVQK